MRKAKYQWHQLSSDQTDLVQTIQEQCQIPSFLAQLLVERGCDSLEKAQHFLKPQLQDLHGPEELHGIEAAVEKIEAAISQDWQITVYGDYDADGLTSTALMYETLRDIGAKVDYYIPNRFTDGYGPNQAVYQRLIEQGTQLILTVDNGRSSLPTTTLCQPSYLQRRRLCILSIPEMNILTPIYLGWELPLKWPGPS